MIPTADADFAPMRPLKLARLNCLYWKGRRPREGEYIRSRGPATRYAYRVVGVTMRWRPERKTYTGIITAERLPVDQVPEDARVHWWTWCVRRKRRLQPKVLNTVIA